MLSDKQIKAKKKAKGYFLQANRAAAAAIGGAPDSFSFDKNIIGIGIGPKLVSGSIIEVEDAVRVYVRVKIPKNDLSKTHLVPDDFNGLPTDVIEVGEIVAQATMKTWQRFKRGRPASCGVSVGHPLVTAGTLGCLVEKDNTHFILSNNHILANSNDVAPGDPNSVKSHIGDAIIQQGTVDGGSSPADNIAVLSDWKAFDFSGAANEIDAAIAEVGDTSQTKVESDIIDIGLPRRTPKTAALYQSVRKHGRTTGHTVGVITDLSADIWVGFNGLQAWFEDQIAITGIGNAPFSQGGDSGSLIVDAVSLEPVGLLFAGGSGLTFANKIDAVLNYFNVNVVGQ